eukprot:CAMPEP_0172297356 /NCGR_PEP_ID=MMETSP1058-20130122/413_1 /TAXON_ID=83371 /ORGANISM="Detonula confervacea, Strain CCMP 353" /LENGTH=338 /DNA_ID=CAMNT_0013006503 /DNA_START=136 /DNA_END=1149 /DNA_ORIENTATION=-
MEQQQQQQQQQPSPVRGIATATANAALAAGITSTLGVTRSTSIESQSASSIGNRSNTSASVGGGSIAGGSHNNSFRTSPLTTPRLQSTAVAAVAGGVPPFPNVGARNAAAPAAAAGGAHPVVAPPPWPISATTPQRASAAQQSAIANMTPARSSSQNAMPLASSPQLVVATQSNSTMPPPPPVLMSENSRTLSFPTQPSLSLTMTKSGESMFSIDNNSSVANNADSSVLLGLEELERQQAHVEKRRAEKHLAEQRRMAQQQQQMGGGGLPPLAPTSNIVYPTQNDNRGPTSFGHGSSQQYPKSAPHSEMQHGAVPSEINLFEDDEDTILSHDVPLGSG